MPGTRSAEGDNQFSAADDPTALFSAVEVHSAEFVVYSALRREIVRGLAPGTPLRLAQLASRFQVSTMPVRSAIARLESEGLVVQRPRRGAVVTGLTVEDFTDLYSIRAGLEGEAARIGAVAVSDDDVDRMRSTWLEMGSLDLGRPDIVDVYLELEWRLHDICYEAGKRPRLLRLIRVYRRQAERYFRLSLGELRELAVDVEHQEELIAACADRDPDRAQQALRTLSDWTASKVLPALGARGDASD
jgi:GntR family transcriptional regulator, rspAB operon transcriptional repressor